MPTAGVHQAAAMTPNRRYNTSFFADPTRIRTGKNKTMLTRSQSDYFNKDYSNGSTTKGSTASHDGKSSSIGDKSPPLSASEGVRDMPLPARVGVAPLGRPRSMPDLAAALAAANALGMPPLPRNAPKMNDTR